MAESGEYLLDVCKERGLVIENTLVIKKIFTSTHG